MLILAVCCGNVAAAGCSEKRQQRLAPVEWQLPRLLGAGSPSVVDMQQTDEDAKNAVGKLCI